MGPLAASSDILYKYYVHSLQSSSFMANLHSTVIMLEGITHLEDLSLREFIRTVETLKDKVVTEKLDGNNLWFGVDENGVFTSREGKSPKKGRFYKVEDYPMVANYNGFRAAHLAIEKMAPIIKKVLEPDDMVEIEVLAGRQPNTVTYGVKNKNFIVILRGVNDTPQERVDALSKAVDNKQASVSTTMVSSSDGDTLQVEDEKQLWEFTNVKPMDAKKVDTKQAMGLLAQLKKYMLEPNKVVTNLSNEEVAEISLTSVPKERREAAKKERDRVQARITNEFKLPIKELLLNNLVRKIKPFLQDENIHPSEDIGVEGVVVRDPVTGSQTKIVDKDVFTAINTFNSAVRANIAGLVRTTDQDAAIEMRGGAFGQAKIRIAELLGARELAMSSGVKRFITKFKGSDETATARSLANSLNISSVPAVRTKISAILKNLIQEIDEILHSFKKEAGEFKLKLKTGKEIGLTPEIMKRTLTAFAETKKDIAEINTRVLKSRTAADLVLALYGKTINAIFSEGGSDVKESYSLLRLVHENEGSGAEGQAVDPKSYGNPVAATTSVNTAALPMNLMKGAKVIERRTRAFVKLKKFPAPAKSTAPKMEGKFSLIRSMNEDWAHVRDMKFATDVDDTVQAKNDVEFNQLRNNVTIGNDLTQMDVNRYLDKAHEINDTVDTVAFGMEMDDGSIAKVYVNAAQADQFEQALAALLGQEDDTETVINDLARTFDIVDVEWPREQQSSGEDIAPPATDSISPEDDYDTEETSEISQEETPPESDAETNGDIASAEDEIDFSTVDDDEEEDEASSEDEDEDDETPSENEDEDDETPSENEDEASSENEDDNEEIDEFGQLAKKKSKKKKQTTEESMQSFGDRLKYRLLTEAKKPQIKKKEEETDPVVDAGKVKFAKALDDLLEFFPTKQDKAIITMMVALGVPIRSLSLHKAELRKQIDPVSEMYLKNGAFRVWAKKLVIALTAAEEEVNEDANFEKRLTNKYQQIIYGILRKLGLPEGVETTSSRQLAQGIRSKAAIANKNNQLRIYLKAIAEQLGVDDDKGMSEPTVKEDVQVFEAMEDAQAAVTEFLTTLGFDLAANRSINAQGMRQQVKSPMMKLASNPSIVSRLNILNKMIQAKVKTASNAPQLASVIRTGPVVSEEAADQGKWIVGKMGSAGLLLKVKGMTIKMDDDEVGKLAIGLKGHKKMSVKDERGVRFIFKPLKHGSFAVKRLDDTDFPDGIHMAKDTVSEIMGMIGGAE